MKKKEEISKNNKKIWEEFVKNPTNLYDKDANKRYDENQKRYRYDLHGFSLEEANIKVKEIINSCFDKNFKQILLITGKGLHSNSDQDVYASKNLSKLRFAVPEYIYTNSELKKKVLNIKVASPEEGGEGAIVINLKNL